MYKIRLSYCLEQRKGKVKDDTKVLSQSHWKNHWATGKNSNLRVRISLELS